MRLLLGVLLLLVGAAPADAEVSDRLTRTVPLTPGTLINVQVTVGHVNIAGWDRSDMTVDIVRRAPTAEKLAMASAVIEGAGEIVSIRAVQAEDGRDASIRTDVVMRVPASARLADVGVFEGRIELSALSGQVSAHADRGEIVAQDVAGTIRLETSIGNIRVTRATLEPQGLMRLRTFNGDVTVLFAKQPQHARVLALALNGRITSDVPLNRKERWGPRWAEATIGNGDAVLSVDVVNGNINLKLTN
jgi:DUF4097 and DUF4098 domain-containing protein YvlB